MPTLRDATTHETITIPSLRVDSSGRNVRVLATSPYAVLVQPVDMHGSPTGKARRVDASEIGAEIVP